MPMHMPNRITLVVPAVLVLILAVSISTSRSSSAAAEACLAKPDGTAPPGSHWYYRADRVTQRQCWFLRPNGQKPRQALLPKRLPPPRPLSPQAEGTPAEAKTGQSDLEAAFSTRWPSRPRVSGSIEQAPAPIGNSYTDERALSETQDEMPLIWPVLSAAELSAAEEPPKSSFQFGHPAFVFGALAGALALAAITARAVMKLSVARHRRRVRDQVNLARRRIRELRPRSDLYVEIPHATGLAARL
jgi:hypothetical protein